MARLGRRLGHWTNQLRTGGGRFRNVTLQDLGVPKDVLTDGPLICSKCGRKWRPVIKQDPCFDCQAAAPDAGREGR